MRNAAKRRSKASKRVLGRPVRYLCSGCGGYAEVGRDRLIGLPDAAITCGRCGKRLLKLESRCVVKGRLDYVPAVNERDNSFLAIPRGWRAGQHEAEPASPRSGDTGMAGVA